MCPFFPGKCSCRKDCRGKGHRKKFLHLKAVVERATVPRATPGRTATGRAAAARVAAGRAAAGRVAAGRATQERAARGKGCQCGVVSQSLVLFADVCNAKLSSFPFLSFLFLGIQKVVWYFSPPPGGCRCRCMTRASSCWLVPAGLLVSGPIPLVLCLFCCFISPQSPHWRYNCLI